MYYLCDRYVCRWNEMPNKVKRGEKRSGITPSLIIQMFYTHIHMYVLEHGDNLHISAQDLHAVKTESNGTFAIDISARNDFVFNIMRRNVHKRSIFFGFMPDAYRRSGQWTVGTTADHLYLNLLKLQLCWNSGLNRWMEAAEEVVCVRVLLLVPVRNRYSAYYTLLCVCVVAGVHHPTAPLALMIHIASWPDCLKCSNKAMKNAN